MYENVLWELTKLRRHLGGTPGLAFYAVGVVMLGILAPLYFRYSFFSPRVLLLYTCLPLLFTPPVVAESVAGERELKPEANMQRHDWLYGKIGAGAVYGWISVVVVFVLAMAALRAILGRFLDLPLQFLIGLTLVSFATSVFAASLAAAVAMSARSAKAAKRTMRQGLLLLLILLLFLSRQPWVWTHRLGVPEDGPAFLEFAMVISVVFAAFAAGLARLALHSAESSEIRLNL